MSQIKVIKETPLVSVCSYPEAVFRMHPAYLVGDEIDRGIIAFTIAHIYARDKAVVGADLARGVP
jgi:hypothetical protein